MNTHSFNALFAALSLIALQSAWANPSTYTHANGSTIVDINAADANGLSHNMWTDFNVTSSGMVLNNSTSDVVRDSGNIAKNNNLTSAASVILNEVVSRKASELKGALEVVGNTADVIIANPNGIVCSGCSFVNTSRTTLTTGAPIFTDSALTGYSVKSGTITVNGLTNSGNYTDILADTVRITGQLETGTLKAIAGTYTYDRTTDTLTAASATSSNVGIDISALGGVTAGVIQLQTTKSGSGVNNNGVLSADSIRITSGGILSNRGSQTATTLMASSTGTLSNSGSMTATNMQLGSANQLVNSGTIRAGSALYTTAARQITNSGTLSGGTANQIVSYAGNINNSGTISSDGLVYAIGGYVPVDGVLTAAANTSINNLSGGTIAGANGVVMLATQAVNNAGSITSDNLVSLTAASVQNSAAVTAPTLTASATSFTNTGTMTASGQLTVTGTNRITNYGTLKANSITLNTDGNLTGKRCKLWLFCSSGTLSADSKIQINAPLVKKASDLEGTIITPILELNNSTS